MRIGEDGVIGMRRTRSRRRLLFSASACVALLLIAGCVALAFNARVADHFGYALPGASGLPSRISYAGRDYSSSGACWTSAQVRQQGMWPLHEVAQVPTLLGQAHPVLSETVRQGMTTTLLVIPQDSCYAVYSLEGGP